MLSKIVYSFENNGSVALYNDLCRELEEKGSLEIPIEVFINIIIRKCSGRSQYKLDKENIYLKQYFNQLK